MSDYLLNYLESNLVCFIIFLILFLRDLFGGDRQEKQIKFDRALIAFMLYFVSDVIWAAVIDGAIPQTDFSIAATNFANYFLMAGITYLWLDFVLAYEQVPHRNRSVNKFAVIFPFILATLGLIGIYIFVPNLLFDGTTNMTVTNTVFLIAVPIINIIAILLYTLRRAKKEAQLAKKKDHIAIGLFPLIVIVGGILQVVLFPKLPIFCSCCTILMLILYIKSLEQKISIDPLTGLNNRGQLMRYVSQDGTFRREKHSTYVMMVDANDFKGINDTYGHAEGDHALVLIADALRSVTANTDTPSFLCRYGGDEFLLILHPTEESEVDAVANNIREAVLEGCKKRNTPYLFTVGIGYDKFLGEEDSFQSCMQRADYKLYLDKEYCKLHRNDPKG